MSAINVKNCKDCVNTLYYIQYCKRLNSIYIKQEDKRLGSLKDRHEGIDPYLVCTIYGWLKKTRGK